jgi:hypothetical protein
MRLLIARLVCLVVAGGSLCAIATGATPGAVSPKKPAPVDAGIDGVMEPLPPVPDAGAPIVRDAATPMQPNR